MPCKNGALLRSREGSGGSAPGIFGM